MSVAVNRVAFIGKHNLINFVKAKCFGRSSNEYRHGLHAVWTLSDITFWEFLQRLLGHLNT